MESHYMFMCLAFYQILFLFCQFCSAGQCVFEYIHQPPSTTLNCCKPYQNGFIVIALECIVKNQTSGFEIRWFRENTTGAVEDLGLGDPDKPQENNMHWFSRYHDSDFMNKKYNLSYLGKYWCQVINTTADPDQPLMRSNVFTLLAPENYTQPTCVNQSAVTQSISNVTCADLPIHSEKTTLPAPATTSSNVNYFNTSDATSSLLSSTPHSPASPTANGLPIVYPVAAVLSAVIVIISVIAVTVILLVLVRRQRKKKNCEVDNKTDTKKDKIEEQSRLQNPLYVDYQVVSPPPTHNDDQQSSHYQPLDTATTDYTSMYTTPCTSAGKKGAPSVKIGDQEYAIVDPTRREEHTYTIPQ